MKEKLIESGIKIYQKDEETLYRVSVRVYGPNGRRTSKQKSGIKTLDAARKLKKKLEQQAFHNSLVACTSSQRWRDVVEAWGVAAANRDIFIKPVSRSTIDDYVAVVWKLAPEWLNLPTDKIDKVAVWTKFNQIEDEISITRRKRFRSAFDAIYRWAILKKLVTGIESLPSEGFRTHRKVEEKKPQILKLDEIRKLLEAARRLESPWYPIWAVALLTGCRSGELYALQWDHVDFEKRVLFIHRNWTNKSGFGPTKGRYWRTVPMNSQLERLLKERRQNTGSSRFVLPHFQSWTDGRQAEELKKFLVGVGLPPVKFHTLRACFATQLIADGIAPAQIMKICGWKDLKTMERYIRLAGIDVKGATDGLKLLSPAETMENVVNLFRV